MMRNRTFTFVCNDDERRLIAALAEYLNRSQSDAVRTLIIQAAREFMPDAPRGAIAERIHNPPPPQTAGERT